MTTIYCNSYSFRCNEDGHKENSNWFDTDDDLPLFSSFENLSKGCMFHVTRLGDLKDCFLPMMSLKALLREFENKGYKVVTKAPLVLEKETEFLQLGRIQTAMVKLDDENFALDTIVEIK